MGDAMREKEERRCAADEGSDDEGAAKHLRSDGALKAEFADAGRLLLPKTELAEAHAPRSRKAPLQPPQAAAAEMGKEEAKDGAPKVEVEKKEESDDDPDLASMQQWRRLDAELSDEELQVPRV